MEIHLNLFVKGKLWCQTIRRDSESLNGGHGEPSGWKEAAISLHQPGLPVAASTQPPWLHEGRAGATPGDSQAVLATGQCSPHSLLSYTQFEIFEVFQKKKKIGHNQKNFCKNKTFHLLKKFHRNLNIQQSKAQSKVLRRVTFLSKITRSSSGLAEAHCVRFTEQALGSDSESCFSSMEQSLPNGSDVRMRTGSVRWTPGRRGHPSPWHWKCVEPAPPSGCHTLRPSPTTHLSSGCMRTRPSPSSPTPRKEAFPRRFRASSHRARGGPSRPLQRPFRPYSHLWSSPFYTYSFHLAANFLATY